MNKSSLLLSTLVALALSLSGCKDASTPPASDAAPKEAPSSAVSIEAIAAEAKGFTVGSAMTVKTVYVFFDSQCPHCAALWETAKPLKSQAKFIWIPVRILNDVSEAQGAALLAAKDPVAAMDEHEASMKEQKGGISAVGDLDAQRAMIRKNTDLMNRFGFASVPSIVARHAVSGALLTREGSMPTADLANFLGLQIPAGK